MRAARCIALALGVTALAGASARDNAPLAPEVVLANYEQALAQSPHPKNVSFEFSVEQLGLRNMEQTHRIYRSGLKERDETLVVDGYHLKAPAVRIIASRTNRYEIARVAPKTDNYAFTYSGAVNESDAYGYVFATQARGTTAYAITEIELDGNSFLPRIVRFRIAGAGARGSGTLTFARVDRYWLVVGADVSAHLTSGAIAHEIMHWSNYHFPQTLPGSTFEAPRAVPEPLPLATVQPPALPDSAVPPVVP